MNGGMTCPLSGAKRTSLFAVRTSAYDPKRTLGVNGSISRSLQVCKMLPFANLTKGIE